MATEYARAIRARAEDHGLVPEEGGGSVLTFEITESGLEADDAEYLEEGEILEEL